MNKISTIIVCFLLVTSCKNDVNNNVSKKEKVNNNLNLIITPDLSNRITIHTKHKPLNDTLLIKTLLNSYYPNIYGSNNRLTGQKDQISFLFTNSTIITEHNINMENLDMDFSEMTDGKRIQYFVSHTESIAPFEFDKEKMNNEVRKFYNNSYRNVGGADIFNFFNSKIKASKIKKNKKPLKINQTTVYNNQRNILILFTDGYIEAGMSGNENCKNNSCVFLDKKRVDNFRTKFKASAHSDMKAFFEENNYGIEPVKNDLLKDLEVIVVEMYDRSLADSGSQRKIPNDLDILKLFWADWLQKSGVKRHKLLGTVNSVDEFEKNIISFIEDN